jgi:hypothetical protein
MRKLLICLALIVTAGCSTFRGPAPQPAQAVLPPDHYVVFFQPRTSELAVEAQAIVRQAAMAAQQRKASKIEIAVPPAVPGGPNVVEGRYTAIQNIISASGANPGVYTRSVLSQNAAALPGGTDRAEITLVQ